MEARFVVFYLTSPKRLIKFGTIINKLVYIGVPMYIIRFISSFLTNRFFKVKDNNAYSYLHPISSSVPQSSVLGPLFFFNKTGKIFHIIQRYLKNLMVWLFTWRLKMNASKCCYTIFSGNGRGDISFDLRLWGEPIPYNANPVF